MIHRVASLVVPWVLLLAPAYADWETVWERLDVQAQLTNDGRFLVQEWLHVRLKGQQTDLDRKIVAATDQRFVLQKLVREDGESEVELKPTGFRTENGYSIKRDEVTWWIAGDYSRWRGETVTFRFDYEIKNAIAPVWDIPAGPDKFTERGKFPHFISRVQETIGSWKEARQGLDRIYRLDHDILFPTLSVDGPLELNYTLQYDTAWAMVDPSKPVGHGTHRSDYRVTHLFRYLPQGRPTAVEWWRPDLRVGSLLALPVVAGLLWIIFAIDHVRRTGLRRSTVSRTWFEENIVAHPVEVISRLAGNDVAIRFAPFLARMRKQKMIAVKATGDEDDMEVELRLEGDPASLAPHERLVIAALFPGGPRSGSKILARHYSQSGFDADDVLRKAVQQEVPPPSSVRDSLWWRMQRLILPLLFLGAVVLVIFGLLEKPDYPYAVLYGFLSIVPLLLFASIGQIVNDRGGRMLPLTAGFVTFGVAAVFVMHFVSTQPLSAYGAAGMAVFAVWWVAALLHTIRSADLHGPISRDPLILDGQYYARAELRKPEPDLMNSWLPHVRALGLTTEIERWHRRFPHSKSPSGFTGKFDFTREEDWSEALFVPSAKERAEFEEEERAARKSGA